MTVSLLILFLQITARLFSIAAPLPALSILTIFQDKCQMKRFEDINILIKVKLFCLKTLFFLEKSFCLKKKFLKRKLKKLLFRKKSYLKQKNFLFHISFFWKKKIVLEKNFFRETFSAKKNFF